MTNAFKKQITIPLWAAITGGGVILFLLLMCCALGAAVGSVPSKKVSDDISVTDQPSTTAPTTVAAAPPTTAIADPCANREHCVSYVNLDAPWPLTVEWVQVDCLYHYSNGTKQKMVWAKAPDGTAYAVNGTARNFLDMRPIDEIWVVQMTGVKIDLTPIINVGLLLCK